MQLQHLMTQKNATTAALNSMNSSVTLSSADKVSAALKNTNGSMNQSAKTGYSDLKDQVANNDFLGKLLPAYTTITNDTSVEYRLSQVDGMSGDDLSQNVANKTKNGASYPVNFTVTAYDTANKNVVGTKNITINFTGATTNSAEKVNLTFDTASAKVGDNSYNFNLGYQAVKDLIVKDDSGNAIKASGTKAQLTKQDNSAVPSTVISSDTGNFLQNTQLKQTLTFTIPAINTGTTSNPSYKVPREVSLNGTPVSPVSDTANETTSNANITYQVTRNVVVYNNDISATPFFSVNGTTASNGSIVTLKKVDSADTETKGYSVNANGVVQAGSSAKTSQIAKALNTDSDVNNNKVQFNYGTGVNTDNAIITKDDIANGIKSIGGKVDSDGLVSGLKGVNYIPVTVYSPINNKSANIQLLVNFSASTQNADTSLPGFTFDNNTDSSKATLNPSDITLIQGQKFNAYDGVKSFDNTNNSAPEIMSGYWTVSNPVNTNVPGSYTVTYSVTNSQGKTTSVNRKVNVLSVNNAGVDKVVNFVPGYGVMVWSATDNAVNATSDFVQHGTTVKTFDTKTVDGVSYTRINKANSNQWVQSKYFDANANNAPQTNNNDNNTNTDSNKETPFESTLTINYVPGYRVFLRDGQANMQQQSVAHGESFKVWAKKTVGNHTYYRIGTDAQWIEDTYAQF